MTLADTISPSIASPGSPPPPRRKQWTKREYNDLVERGELRGQPIYLFRGDIIQMPPQYHPHAFGITQLTKALTRAFGIDAGHDIRIQLPFETPGESMPEPDGLVCTEAQGLRKPHPDRALLVVEVADSSLAYDREKALEYAAAGVQEYWIVDVNRRGIEVYRHPVEDLTAPLGFRYPPPVFIDATGQVKPLAAPSSSITVAKLFSPA